MKTTKGDQIAFFSPLGLYWSSPDSGGFQYKSRELKPRFDPQKLVVINERLEMVTDDMRKAKGDQIAFFEPPDLYHRSPDSGELQYKSRELKTRFDPQKLVVIKERLEVVTDDMKKAAAHGDETEVQK
jgi:hypothetical protein